MPKSLRTSNLSMSPSQLDFGERMGTPPFASAKETSG
jgi:hypothetical protein